MAYEIRDDSGSLFKNKKKDSDKSPNATGNAVIGGVRYRVSAWTKTDKSGNPWQSLSFRRDDEGERAPAERRGSLKDELDSDIPF